MKREQILNVFKSLAYSQGAYGRLLQAIEDNPEQGDAFLNHLEEQNFNDEVDLILYLES